MRTRARHRVAGLGRLLALALAIAGACSAGRADPRPNVLFVLADDLRWDALGAYGNRDVRTPHLDALAADGLRFQRFYVASPVCSPSRASFLTGLAVSQPGIETDPGSGRLRLVAGVATVARELAAAGYATGFVGKAHLGGDPLRWGFEEAPLVLPGRRFGDPGPPSRQELRAGGRSEWIDGHATERLADAAIEFIERPRDRPWFLWMATTAPHHPYTPDPGLPVDPGSLAPPPGWPPDAPLENRREWAHYYSLIGRLDRELGRVLARLEASGQAERTLVWIASDNGLQLGSQGLRGKAVWYDASTRVPALVRWPGVTPAGAEVASAASSLDLLPTLAEIAGRPPLPGRRGRSLLPALRGEPVGERIVLSEVAGVGRAPAARWRMLTDGRAKLVEGAGGAGRRWLDLERDPGERGDGSTLDAARRRALLRALADWPASQRPVEGSRSR
jgi:arylsulfatase A-like enzyme